MSKAKFVAGARIESHQHMIERVNRHIQAVQREIRDTEPRARSRDVAPLYAELDRLEQQRDQLIG